LIGFDVGPCDIGAPRARHALTQLALMPRAEGEPLVVVAHGRTARPTPGPRVVIPHMTPHVPRDVTPEMFDDAGVDVPVMYPAAVPEGEVLAAGSEGHPLLVRSGDKVHFGFDVVRAADYYLNGRGEVGWARDGDGRPLLESAPLWRRETVGVAVVNRYARLLARACEAAARDAPYPFLRFRWWPHGAHFALALSHDVDRLFAPPRGDMLRAMLRPRRGGPRASYTLRDILRGAALLQPLPAIIAVEEVAGGLSTFFVGAERQGPLDYDYDLAGAARLVGDLTGAGREVALHSSYYTVAEGQALKRQRGALAERSGNPVAGVRGHYLRLAAEPAWSAIAEAGFAYDASFGHPAHPGWRGGAALPWRPFAAADEKPYDFTLVPLAVMDGTLFQYHALSKNAAFRAARDLIDEAAAVGGVATLNWHYRAFKGGVFPMWGQVYKRIVGYALTRGAQPMTHAAVAARYAFNAGIAARGRGDGEYELTLRAGGEDVMFDIPTGWRLTGGDVAASDEGVFLIRGGAGRTVARFTRVP